MRKNEFKREVNAHEKYNFLKEMQQDKQRVWEMVEFLSSILFKL